MEITHLGSGGGGVSVCQTYEVEGYASVYTADTTTTLLCLENRKEHLMCW
jgi:hypothetical protein